MIVAAFHDPASLQDAVSALRQAGLAADTRTPVALSPDEHGPSRIPRPALALALTAFAAAFAMQCYANMVGYPQLIGGRPAFFWTSYLVYAVECGVLAAIATCFVGFLVANRLPRYWEPADECDALRAATRDGWFLLTEGEEASRLLARFHPTSIERLP